MNTQKEPTSLCELVANTPDTLAFIEGLGKLIPDCHPLLQDSDREIWRKVGARNLVVTLEQIVRDLKETQE